MLFRLVGGPKKVNEYIHNLGLINIAIVNTEEEMHKDWKVQFSNWSAPLAMGQLLSMFYRGKVLSKESTEFLWKTMVGTNTGARRIKGLLPEGTIVAHKTGSSGANGDGVIAAANDVGIVTLPNGKHFIIVVFVSNSTADEDTCDNVIAKIAKTVWESYEKE